ncbi:MAG: hypothetical protein WC871_03515 [Bacteroidales bacterium]
MKSKPNNFYDLAIVDPTYGIDVAKSGKVGGNNCGTAKDYGAKKWDKSRPPHEYFVELFRVSKHQIIWGGNYFINELLPTSCFIVWDKDNTGNFADCELAWTSFDANTCKIKYDPLAKGDYKGKIHPCQKPVTVYDWILQKYAKPCDY